MKKAISFLLTVVMIMLLLPTTAIQVNADYYNGAGNRELDFGQRDFQWPVPSSNSISSCFLDYMGHNGSKHSAIDISAGHYQRVEASYNGTVETFENSCTDDCPIGDGKDYGEGYGNYVVLRHNYVTSTGSTVVMYTRYSHLSSVDSSLYNGKTVYAGDRIGSVGSTGSSTGYHVDFQICYGGWSASCSVDPYVNDLLEMPSGFNANGASSWCTCCYNYVEYVKELYSHPVAASSFHIEPGVYTIHSARDWNKALDITGDSTASGANIQLYDYLNNDVQKFRIVKEGNYYCIQSVYSGMWLDVSYPYESWSNVQLWYTNENNEEKWVFEDAGNGYVYIRNFYGNYVDLVGDSTENGTNVQLYHSKESDSQRWRLIPVEEPVSVEPGIYTIHSARDWNKVVDILGDSKESGANIQLYDCLNNDVQKFEVVKDGDYYYIRSVYSGNWLDVAWPITETRSNVQLVNHNTNPEQKWIFEDGGNGYVYIRNYYGNYLDLAGDSTDNYTNIQVFHAKESDSQRWRLIREPEPVEIPEGIYTIHSAWDNGKVLDILYDSQESGANIQLYDNLNNDVQKFELIKSGNYYYIRSVYSGMWLDVAWPSIESRSNVQLYKENTNPEEKWMFEDAGNGYVYIRNYYGNYLDIQYDSAINYANVQVYHAKESNSQRWRLRPLAYKIGINGNGGTASTVALQVKYGEYCNLSPTFVSREGFTLKGWNLHRPSDNKWFAAGVGWRTEEEIAENGYTKSLYPTDLSMQLETSWLNNADTYFIDSFTFYAVWEEDVQPCTHDYVAEVTSPTCTAQGFTTYTCSICGDSYVDDYVVASGHSFEDGVCSVCGFIMPVVAVTNADAKPGETVTIPVTIANNCGFASFTFEVSCDSGVIISNVAPGEMLQSKESNIFYFNDESGLATYVGQSVVEDGTLLNLEVYVPEESTGGSYSIQLALRNNDPSNICDADGNSIPVSFSDGTITVEPPHVHTYVDVVTDPTCTEKGYTTHTCSSCGESYVDSSVEALGHDWDDGVLSPAPSCTEEGVKSFTCKRCGATKTEAIGATGHTASEPIRENEIVATCTSTGCYDLVVRCTTCNAILSSEHVDVPMAAHNYQATVTEPTCTKQGYTTHVCTVCGDSFVDTYVDALGHDLIHHAAQAPTCTTVGWDAYDTCSRCDYTTYVEKTALGHDYQSAVTDPSCMEQGYTTHTCSRCGDSYVDSYVDAMGHDFGAWTQTVAPTCTEKGEEKHTCSRCDAFEIRDVEALGHNYQAVVTEPTCTAGGYTTYTCSRCNDSYVADETEASGHTSGGGVEENHVNPTCTTNGGFDTVTYCSACGIELTRVHTDLAALGHLWDDGVIDPAATCTSDGVKTFTCQRCGETKTEAVAASGHTPGEPAKENEVAATCTTLGGYDMVIHCTVCNAILYTEHFETAALGHDYRLVVTPPTCTEGGYTTYTCSRCSDSYVADETAALGHTPGDPIMENDLAPSCEVAGGYDMVIYCTVCGAEISREHTDVAALGHDWNEPEYVWADDYSTVTATRTCANDASHVETETVNTTSEVIKEATYDEEGEITYTATFENKAFATQTKAVATPKLEKPDDPNPGLPCDGGDNCPGNVFADMPTKGNWAHDAIDWAIVTGVTSGTSETTFSPNAGCTRAQVVTFLWRAAGSPEPTSNNNPFTDITGGYYYKAVLWAVEKNITSGTSATTFSPNSTCTRAQIVTFLWRYGGTPEPTTTDNPFKDVKPGAYYEKAVLWASETGVTAGTSATTFSPDATCTRAQVVTFLYRDMEN